MLRYINVVPYHIYTMYTYCIPCTVQRSASASPLLALESDGDDHDEAIKKASHVDSSKEETDDEVDYEPAHHIVPDYKQPAEEDIGSTSEEDAPDAEAGVHFSSVVASRVI